MTLDTQPELVELKPCPFCGEAIDDFAGMVPDAFTRCIAQGTFGMGCSRCNSGGPMKPTMEEAISAWNERALPISCEDEVERVALAIEKPFLPHGYELKPHLLKAAARAAIAALEGRSGE